MRSVVSLKFAIFCMANIRLTMDHTVDGISESGLRPGEIRHLSDGWGGMSVDNLYGTMAIKAAVKGTYE